MTNLNNTLENFQKTVEGPIEVVPCGSTTAIICNEEGKLRGLEHNFRMGYGMFADVICGTVAVVGVDGEDFCDLPISFDVWKWLLESWGNKA